MSKPQIPKTKQSLWNTLKIGWGPYRRLFSYAGPYKFRLMLGVGFGFLAGPRRGRRSRPGDSAHQAARNGHAAAVG